MNNDSAGKRERSKRLVPIDTVRLIRRCRMTCTLVYMNRSCSWPPATEQGRLADEQGSATGGPLAGAVGAGV